MAEVELHDEVVEWLAILTDTEWERVGVIVATYSVQVEGHVPDSAS